MTINKRSSEAIAAFNDNLDASLREAKLIVAKLEAIKKEPTNNVTWSHAEGAEHMKSQLKSLADIILQRGEYAPSIA